MEPILFRYRGRDLCAVDIAFVRATIAAHYAGGRSFIAQVLCEHWAWYQPNGAYKGFAARDLLLRLEEAGHVTLPPRKAVKNNRAEPRFDRIPHYAESPLSGRVGDHPPPRIVEVSGMERTLWDYLVHHYHYLGRPRLVGEHLKQLVFMEGKWWDAWGGRVRPGRVHHASGGSAGASRKSARGCLSSRTTCGFSSCPGCGWSISPRRCLG